MNADELELLVRRSLEHDASTQPVAADLHRRSVAYGRRITRRRRATAAALAMVVAFAAVISVAVSGNSRQPRPAVQPKPTPEPTLTVSATTRSKLSSIAAHVERLPSEGQGSAPWWYERIIAQRAGRTDVGELWQSRAGNTEVLLDGSSTKVSIHNVVQGNVGPDASWAIYNLPDVSPETFYFRQQDAVQANAGSGAAALPLAGDMVGRIEALLERGEFPPVSRALLLRTLALVPSVQLNGTAKIRPAGRGSCSTRRTPGPAQESAT